MTIGMIKLRGHKKRNSIQHFHIRHANCGIQACSAPKISLRFLSHPVNRKDCADFYSCGQTVSGVYTIHPDSRTAFCCVLWSEALPVEAGRYFKRDWTVLLISTAAGMTTNRGLGTWMASIGWDLISWTSWPRTTTRDTNYAWIWRILQEIQCMPSTVILLCPVSSPSTS